MADKQPPMQQTRSPVDGRIYAERPLADDRAIDVCLDAAREAQRGYRGLSLEERMALCGRLVDAVVADATAAATELTWQMGRPIRDSPGELRGFEERARRMIELAPEGLADIQTPEQAGLTRYIRRAPLGVVLVLSPWNYPFLTSVNAIIPALLAGNTVVLKHSSQTPLVAERYQRAAEAAGFPTGVVQVVHAGHGQVAKMVADPRVDYVAFTGSVEGGRAVQRAAAERFIFTGLELGGKDPAYVREDADVPHAAEQLVDGAFYNCGQSCCGVERIYVQAAQFDGFVDAFVAAVERYVLGDPTDSETTLGPMVRTSAADFVRAQTAAAVASGARAHIDSGRFARAEVQTPYLAPQVLTQVDHSMAVMRDESFGPVVGIMPVRDDAEAVALMNDSAFGLSASLWTPDLDAAARIGEQLETGTVFANRCDYLDPDLAWTGVKDSGRGCTLSSLGFGHLTRPKSFHLRTL